MPLRLDMKRMMALKTNRVKCLDFHPTDTLVLISLHDGDVEIWDYSDDSKVSTFEACAVPVRAGVFIPQKNWVVTGGDDMRLKVFDCETSERLYSFVAHNDYIRCLIVHSTHSYVLSCSDDMLIKLWGWDLQWECIQVFKGHVDYVMQIDFNPKNPNSFVSASLDTTIKVWNLAIRKPFYTMEGHKKGVNCVQFHHGPIYPYVISGGDDFCVKIWDYQAKMCIYTLEGHTAIVTAVAFHPELPIIMAGTEDGTLRLWHETTYLLEGTFNFGYDRIWALAVHHGTSEIVIGCDLGSIMVKIGRDQPPISMDGNGEKIIYSKNYNLYEVNLKALPKEKEINDGDHLELPIKGLGTSEILPHTMSYNFDGSFVGICGFGEYVIYNAVTLKSKMIGNGLELVWAANKSVYAVMVNTQTIKVLKNFKERMYFKPDCGADAIFGGAMLGVKSMGGKSISFFDWECLELVRRIDMKAVHIFWSADGGKMCLATDEEYFIVKYNAAAVARARATNTDITIDGIWEAFELVRGLTESVKTGVWVGDCFIYINGYNRLNYFIGGEVMNIAYLDRPLNIVGYVPKQNRLYLSDKEMNIISYYLLMPVVEYQMAVLRTDFECANNLLREIPAQQMMKVAYFLEKQGFKKQALAISTDLNHKFELALTVGNLDLAKDLAEKADQAKLASSTCRWTRLSAIAARGGNMELSKVCCKKSGDYGNLLIYATTVGDKALMKEIGEMAREKGEYNVAFLCYFTLGELFLCIKLLIDAQRFPEAACFARSYVPSKVPQMLVLWKRHIATKSLKTPAAIAKPDKFDNLFPNFLGSMDLETFQKEYGYTESDEVENAPHSSASNNTNRNLAQEEEHSMRRGFWTASPCTSKEDEDDFERDNEIRRRRLEHPERFLCEEEAGAVGNIPVPGQRAAFDMDELERELKALEEEISDAENHEIEEYLDDESSSVGLF